MLILQRRYVQSRTIVESGFDWVENREPVSVRVAVIEQKTAHQDVCRRDVHLKTAQIARGEVAALILTPRQAADYVNVVKRVEIVTEPGPAMHHRPRDLEPGRPLVDHEPVLIRDPGDEVGAGKSPAVVSHGRLDIQR